MSADEDRVARSLAVLVEYTARSVTGAEWVAVLYELAKADDRALFALIQAVRRSAAAVDAERDGLPILS
jgi:hypothetical protein